VAKAELFDEKVGIGLKPSGTRIAMILTDYAEKLERVREVKAHYTHVLSTSQNQFSVTSSTLVV
jgi:hypothetical protein